MKIASQTSKEKESWLTHALMAWSTLHKTVSLSLLFHYIDTVSFQILNWDLSTWQKQNTGNIVHKLMWLCLGKATMQKPHRNMAMIRKIYLCWLLSRSIISKIFVWKNSKDPSLNPTSIFYAGSHSRLIYVVLSCCNRIPWSFWSLNKAPEWKSLPTYLFIL